MEQYIQGLLNAHYNDIKLIRQLPHEDNSIKRLIQAIKHQALELLTTLYIGDKLTTEKYEEFYQELEEI